MAKELPYFKFEPAEYLTKDVSFCSLAAQGYFINICSYYWQRNCSLTKKQLLKRLKNEDLLSELESEGIIEIQEDDIFIKFLDNQWDEAIKLSKKNSENGRKGGRPKTQIKPKLNPDESQTKGKRREEKRKEENKRDNIKLSIVVRKQNFKQILTPHLEKFGKEILNDFYLYWTEHGPADRKMRFEKEKSFDISRRLGTWLKNEKNFKKEKSGQKEKSKSAAEIIQQKYGLT